MNQVANNITIIRDSKAYTLILEGCEINLQFRINVGHVRSFIFLQLDTSERRGYIMGRIAEVEGWIVDDREWTR